MRPHLEPSIKIRLNGRDRKLKGKVKSVGWVDEVGGALRVERSIPSYSVSSLGRDCYSPDRSGSWRKERNGKRVDLPADGVDDPRFR